MRRSEKTWLIIGGALVLLGILLFVGVMALHQWKFSSLFGGSLEEKVFDVKEAFENIDVKTHTEDISFVLSDDGVCHVTLREPDYMTCSVSVTGGTLCIETKDERQWYEQFFTSFGDTQITVFLPQSEYAALTVSESTGDVTLSNELSFETVDISVSTGDVDCRASAKTQMKLETSTGDVRMEHVTAGSIELETSTGKTLLTEVNCKSLTSSGSTGDLLLKNVLASDSITAKRSTGDITLERCDAGELLLETSTGDVTGSLLSEKVYLTHSSTGSIDVPETTSGGKCRVTTSTGDIIIEESIYTVAPTQGCAAG